MCFMGFWNILIMVSDSLLVRGLIVMTGSIKDFLCENCCFLKRSEISYVTTEASIRIRSNDVSLNIWRNFSKIISSSLHEEENFWRI
jgi:hypothetical protein